MCDYCSTGDLYTYWVMIGQFGEDVVKVFAAELGSALGKQIYMTSLLCSHENCNAVKYCYNLK